MLDREDQWSADIAEAHPTRTGTHREYGVAMEMVGNRHSKHALVELVHWLLVERDAARKSERIMAEALAWNVQEKVEAQEIAERALTEGLAECKKLRST